MKQRESATYSCLCIYDSHVFQWMSIMSYVTLLDTQLANSAWLREAI